MRGKRNGGTSPLRKRRSTRRKSDPPIVITDAHLSDIASGMVVLSPAKNEPRDRRKATAVSEVTVHDRSLRELVELRELNDRGFVWRVVASTFAGAVFTLLLLIASVAAASTDATTAATVAGDLLSQASTFLVAVFGGSVLTIIFRRRR